MKIVIVFLISCSLLNFVLIPNLSENKYAEIPTKVTELRNLMLVIKNDLEASLKNKYLKFDDYGIRVPIWVMYFSLDNMENKRFYVLMSLSEFYEHFDEKILKDEVILNVKTICQRNKFSPDDYQIVILID